MWSVQCTTSLCSCQPLDKLLLMCWSKEKLVQRIKNAATASVATLSLQCRWLGAVTPEVGVDAESVIPDEFENSLEVLAVESGEALSLFLDTEGANLRGVVPPIREDGCEVVVAVDAEQVCHSRSSASFLFGMLPV